MNHLRCLSAAVALLLCFTTPVASAAYGGQSTESGSPTGIAVSASDGFLIYHNIPLCC